MANHEVSTHFVHVDGLRFEVLTCGRGDRFALLLHGFPEHAISWRFQMRFLADLGYTVWAPNLRGYGRSSRPASSRAYTLPHLVADVERLVRASGFKRALLLGHDWGGTIAWYYAAIYPERLTGTAIYNATHPIAAERSITNPRQNWRWSYVQTILDPFLRRAFLHDGGPYACFKRWNIDTTRREKHTYLKNLRRRGGLRAMSNWYRAYLHPRTRELPHHRAVTCASTVPTLVFAGGQDQVLDVSLVDGLEEFAVDLELCVFPHLHHWTNQEAPRQSNAVLADWLQHYESI